MTISSKASGKKVFNFPLPAYKSSNGEIICKQAKDCIGPCYARDGLYKMPVVQNSHNSNYLLSKNSKLFFELMSNDIKSKRNCDFIRIHDGGDFFNQSYLKTWIKLAETFPKIQFYAYTKAVKMLKRNFHLLPDNFRIVFSYGGKQDHFIDKANDNHAIIYFSEKERKELKRKGYIDATKNDLEIFNSSRIMLQFSKNKRGKNANT
jgi:hypothetical protein